MNILTDKENNFIPIIFLFVCSVLLGREATLLPENLQSVGSVFQNEPILITGTISATIINLIKLLLPIALFIFALKQNSVLLKVTYLLAVVPLVLAKPIIIKAGYGNLFFIKTAFLFIVALLLIKYLLSVTKLHEAK